MQVLAAQLNPGIRMILKKDASIHYELAGADQSPLLVLSHALGTDLRLWDLQTELLQRSFRILRYDSRGHGQSSANRGPYSISMLAADVLTLLDELGVARAHFCGVSMGGLVGQYLAAYHPERIGKLILSNTAAKIGTHAKYDRRIQEVTNSGMPAVVHEVLQGWFSDRFRGMQPAIVAALADTLRQTSPEGYIGCCQAIRDADLREEVERIKAPTLIVAGTEDQATTLAASEFLHQKIQGSQLVALESAHLCCTEAAAEFTDHVNRFLTTKTN
jgi:3-oxoadipate enol-lactonase